MADPHLITTTEQLENLYGKPHDTSIAKEIDHINANYRALIEASPFVTIATVGPEGLDCSPKGDPAGFVQIIDARTLAIPDRPGNNRIDGFRNIVRDPRVALLFLIPGCSETLRVNGRAVISIDPDLMARCAIDGKLPRAVMIVSVDRVYFHCAKAVMRSKLWDPARFVDRAQLPSVGTIIADVTGGRLGGEGYDREAPARNAAQLY